MFTICAYEKLPTPLKKTSPKNIPNSDMRRNNFQNMFFQSNLQNILHTCPPWASRNLFNWKTLSETLLGAVLGTLFLKSNTSGTLLRTFSNPVWNPVGNPLTNPVGKPCWEPCCELCLGSLLGMALGSLFTTLLGNPV